LHPGKAGVSQLHADADDGKNTDPHWDDQKHSPDIQSTHHYYRTDTHYGSLEENPHHHIGEVLYLVHVICHPSDQGSAPETVNLVSGEGLYFDVQIIP
jgi:hypothetical protein